MVLNPILEENEEALKANNIQVISIDVGIKNLAYCIIEFNSQENTYKIIKWDIVNLCNENSDVVLCNQTINKPPIKNKNKSKSSAPSAPSVPLPSIKVCNKKAKLYKDNNNYCLTHAKKTEYIIPSPTNKYTKLSNIKKLKLNELKTLVEKYNIILHSETVYTRELLLNLIINFLNDNLLIKVEKKKSANSIDLISMGISLQYEFNKLLESTQIKHVVIENQISPIATRMKTLQGMIAQYFIMKGIESIIFASSINKLKAFILPEAKTVYKDRKKMSVEITKGILNLNNINWSFIFNNNNKKDDLADSFLQGLWFIQTKHFIQIDYTYDK
jgi:hypothetical protein